MKKSDAVRLIDEIKTGLHGLYIALKNWEGLGADLFVSHAKRAECDAKTLIGYCIDNPDDKVIIRELEQIRQYADALAELPDKLGYPRSPLSVDPLEDFEDERLGVIEFAMWSIGKAIADASKYISAPDDAPLPGTDKAPQDKGARAVSRKEDNEKIFEEKIKPVFVRIFDSMVKDGKLTKEDGLYVMHKREERGCYYTSAHIEAVLVLMGNKHQDEWEGRLPRSRIAKMFKGGTSLSAKGRVKTTPPEERQVARYLKGIKAL